MDPDFPPAFSRPFGGKHQNYLRASLFSHSLGLFVPHKCKEYASDLTTTHLRVTCSCRWSVWTHLVPCTISHKDEAPHRPMLCSWLGQSWASSSTNPCGLVLAGIELIFFLVAGTGLCFWFSMRIMLITHWSFSCC